MNNDLTRRLTHGAMMIALFTVLLAISIYVPLLNLITTFFIALPIAWYSAKYSRSSSISVAVIGIIMSMFIGGLAALPVAMIQAPVGFVIGDAIRTRKSKLFMLIATGLTVLISAVIQYIILIKLMNVNIIAEMVASVEYSFRTTGEMMERLGQLPNNYDEMMSDMMMMIEAMIPAVVILSAFSVAFIYLLLYMPILNRLGLEVPKFSKFREMKLPKSVLWYYLVVLLLSFAELEPGTFLFMVVVNASIILRMLLFLQGLAFIHFYIHEQRWPAWVVVVSTILAFPLQTFTVMLGIFDLGFNIRGFVSNSSRK